MQFLSQARAMRSALVNRLYCTDMCCEWVSCLQFAQPMKVSLAGTTQTKRSPETLATPPIANRKQNTRAERACVARAPNTCKAQTDGSIWALIPARKIQCAICDRTNARGQSREKYHACRRMYPPYQRASNQHFCVDDCVSTGCASPRS